MHTSAVARRFPETRLIKPLYALTVALLTLTGFGQMPIFSRYYVADIPGLGWLGDYYFTHTLHYLGAALFLLLATYSVVVFLGLRRSSLRVTLTGYIRTALLAGIIGTGVFRVLKNLPDYYFTPNFVFAVDLAHLGFAMLFLLTLLVARIRGQGWLATAAN